MNIMRLYVMGAIGLLCHAQAHTISYKNLSPAEQKRIASMVTSGGYLQEIYTSHIPKADVRSIMEIGSRDCLDALKLSEHYKCPVIAFECNPTMLEVCRRNMQGNPNVTLVPLAVWNETKSLSFFPMVDTPGVFYNPGSSSCFQVSPDGHHKTYVQKHIVVQATRLDEWLVRSGIPTIDMLCIDAQGAALQVLQGMGAYLDSVKYIITEASHKEIYQGEALFVDIEKFLDAKGFQMYVGTINRFFGDYLFVRKDIIRAWWGD